jgi:hypothetical protein
MKAMLGALLVSLLAATSADAQERHKYFFKAPSGLGQFTQRHVLDVGDVPGHQITLGEFHYKYNNNGPVYGEVKVVESWDRTQADLTNGSGHGFGYRVILLENGDKIFSRLEQVIYTAVTADGAKTSVNLVVTPMSGTGQFKGIRGALKGTGFTDDKGSSDAVLEGEWWIEN